MPIKISQYTNPTDNFSDGDIMDISKKLSSNPDIYESQRYNYVDGFYIDNAGHFDAKTGSNDIYLGAKNTIHTFIGKPYIANPTTPTELFLRSNKINFYGTEWFLNNDVSLRGNQKNFAFNDLTGFTYKASVVEARSREFNFIAQAMGGANLTASDSVLMFSTPLSANTMYIKGDGKIGIGISAPTSLLNVYSASETTLFKVGTVGNVNLIKVDRVGKFQFNYSSGNDYTNIEMNGSPNNASFSVSTFQKEGVYSSAEGMILAGTPVKGGITSAVTIDAANFDSAKGFIPAFVAETNPYLLSGVLPVFVSRSFQALTAGNGSSFDFLFDNIGVGLQETIPYAGTGGRIINEILNATTKTTGFRLVSRISDVLTDVFKTDSSASIVINSLKAIDSNNAGSTKVFTTNGSVFDLSTISTGLGTYLPLSFAADQTLSAATGSKNLTFTSINLQNAHFLNGLFLTNGTNDQGDFIYNSANNYIGLRTYGASNRLAFFTNGNERLNILPNGNVGVNIANPTAPLHIFGNTGLGSNVIFRIGSTTLGSTDIMSVSENGSVSFNSANTNAQVNIKSDNTIASNSIMILSNPTGTQFDFRNNGQVAFGGAIVPNSQLAVYGTQVAGYFTAPGYGIFAQSTSTGIYGGGDSIGVYGKTAASGGMAGYFYANHALAIPSVFEYNASSAGIKNIIQLHGNGTGANGDGASIGYYLRTGGTGTANSQLAGTESIYWTTSNHATKTSAYKLSLFKSGTSFDALTIGPDGIIPITDTSANIVSKTGLTAGQTFWDSTIGCGIIWMGGSFGLIGNPPSMTTLAAAAFLSTYGAALAPGFMIHINALNGSNDQNFFLNKLHYLTQTYNPSAPTVVVWQAI